MCSDSDDNLNARRRSVVSMLAEKLVNAKEDLTDAKALCDIAGFASTSVEINKVIIDLDAASGKARDWLVENGRVDVGKEQDNA